MFSEQRQNEVRLRLLAAAAADHDVVGAAVTGSQARGTADRWSDVDLFLGPRPGCDVADVVASWTGLLERELEVAHWFDVVTERATYRAFLLSDLLEVDVGFARPGFFSAYEGQPFELVLGTADAGPEPTETPDNAAPTTDAPVDRSAWGHAWHHVRHARVCVRRGQLWQALHWTDLLRDVVLAMACGRHRLPVGNARGVDRLPGQLLQSLSTTLVGALDGGSIERAVVRLSELLLDELHHAGLPERDPLVQAVSALGSGWDANPPAGVRT